VAHDDAYRTLAERVAADAAGRRPLLFGISGGVAVGKSTTAELISGHLREVGCSVAHLATDAFLLSNEDLGRAGLTMRKGFPESYDAVALAAALDRLKAGEPAETPVYSHDAYDRVPGAAVVLEPADVVVVEGVNVLQPPVADRLDVSVYVDAEEDHMRAWFLARLVSILVDPEPGTFYATLPPMTEDDVLAFGDGAWATINSVNLRDNILPSRDRATYVLRKGADHAVLALSGPAAPRHP
jgi:type I pantothenate kinase